MSTVYTPNPANNPSTYTLPADTDPATVASVNAALTAMADKIARYQSNIAVAQIAIGTVTGIASTSFVAITGTTLTLPRANLVGDVLEIWASMFYSSSTANAPVGVIAQVSDGGSFNAATSEALYVTGAVISGFTSSFVGVLFHATYTFTNANASPAFRLAGRESPTNAIVGSFNQGSPVYVTGKIERLT
jgi:uncharacterized protein YaiE (UPF0345 family)